MKINKDLKNKIESNALSLATVNSNEKPHLIVVTSAKVVDDKIILTANYMSSTLKNIKQNPNIAITVHSRNWEEDEWGYEITGTAKFFDSGKWKEFVQKIPENAEEIAKGATLKGAVVITVNKINKLA